MTEAVKPDLSFTFNEATRGAYMNVFTPQSFKKKGKEVGDPKYGVTLMMEPGYAGLKALQAKLLEAARSKWPTRDMKELKFPVTTGDRAADKAKAKGKDREFMRGHLILTARSKYPPTLAVLENGKIITLESDALKAKYKSKFYSGCFVAASVNLVPYEGEEAEDEDGNPITKDGVTAYIQSLLWVKDGARLGGSRDQSEVFKSYMGTTTAENPLAGDLDDEIPF